MPLGSEPSVEDGLPTGTKGLTGTPRSHVQDHHAANQEARRKILLALWVDFLSPLHEPRIIRSVLPLPPLVRSCRRVRSAVGHPQGLLRGWAIGQAQRLHTPTEHGAVLVEEEQQITAEGHQQKELPRRRPTLRQPFVVGVMAKSPAKRLSLRRITRGLARSRAVRKERGRQRGRRNREAHISALCVCLPTTDKNKKPNNKSSRERTNKTKNKPASCQASARNQSRT